MSKFYDNQIFLQIKIFLFSKDFNQIVPIEKMRLFLKINNMSVNKKLQKQLKKMAQKDQKMRKSKI
jgi:hypothetical protein